MTRRRISLDLNAGNAARTNSEMPHSVLPLAVDGLGKVEILVAEEDVEEATFVLRERAGSRFDS